jgi:uncharacterized membrane protein
MANDPKPWVLRSLRALLRSTSGNVATLTALLMPAALTLAAFAVDEGSLYLERRHLQNLTDLAAIAAAADTAEPGQAAQALFRANGVDGLMLLTAPGEAESSNTLLVQTGRYAPDPDIAAAERFEVGAEPANAARVTVRTIGTTYFAGRLLPKPTIGTTATASASNLAAFSIGSRLADVDTKEAAPVINELLGNLLGTELSLSAMGYDALLGTDVKLLDFLTALAGKAHIQAGTYDEVLQSDVSIGQFISALAEVSPGSEANAALKTMAAALLSSDLTVPLSHFVSLGPVGRLALGERAQGLDVSANAMSLLSAGAMLADGKHQVALALDAGLPGIAGVTVHLAIGEPPQNSAWFSIGEKGDIVRTAQTRLSLVVEVAGPGGLLGKLLGLSIRVPIYVELAYAEGKLGDIACPTGRPESLRVTVEARPGVAEAWIGEVDTAGMRSFAKSPPVLPAELVKAPLVTVTGTAHATISNPTPARLVFSHADIENGAVKSVSTHNFTGSLFGSLLGDLQLDVKLGPLGSLGLGDVGKALANTLGVASPAIDTLLNGVLATLGIKLGEADVRVTGATCGRSALVQ